MHKLVSHKPAKLSTNFLRFGQTTPNGGTTPPNLKKGMTVWLTACADAKACLCSAGGFSHFTGKGNYKNMAVTAGVKFTPRTDHRDHPTRPAWTNVTWQ